MPGHIYYANTGRNPVSSTIEKGCESVEIISALIVMLWDDRNSMALFELH